MKKLVIATLVLLVLLFSAFTRSAAHPAHASRPLASCATIIEWTAVADTGQLQHNSVITEAWIEYYVSSVDNTYICAYQGFAEYWTCSGCGSQNITVDVRLCASHNHDWCSNLVYDYSKAITATNTGTTVSTSVDNVGSGGVCNSGYTWSSYGAWNDTSGTFDGDIGYGQSYCP